MERPQDLHLLPDETYPTERLISEEIKTVPLVMKNMTQMADFTYKLYMQKLESMKEAMKEAMVSLPNTYYQNFNFNVHPQKKPKPGISQRRLR